MLEFNGLPTVSSSVCGFTISTAEVSVGNAFLIAWMFMNNSGYMAQCAGVYNILILDIWSYLFIYLSSVFICICYCLDCINGVCSSVMCVVVSGCLGRMCVCACGSWMTR